MSISSGESLEKSGNAAEDILRGCDTKCRQRGKQDELKDDRVISKDGRNTGLDLPIRRRKSSTYMTWREFRAGPPPWRGITVPFSYMHDLKALIIETRENACYLRRYSNGKAAVAIRCEYCLATKPRYGITVGRQIFCLTRKIL